MRPEASTNAAPVLPTRGRVGAVLFLSLVVTVLSTGVSGVYPLSDGSGVPTDRAGPAGSRYGVPGDLIHEQVCTSYNEQWDSGYSAWRYVCVFSEPLHLDSGIALWVSVQAVLDFPPQWGWAECTIGSQWRDPLVIRSDYFGWPNWIPGRQAVGVDSELAFLLRTSAGVVWSQYPATGGGEWSSQFDTVFGLVSECADDFRRLDPDPLLSITWWGDYFAGSPAAPERFVIRFYGGTDTGVAPTSWGTIKAMFRR